MELRPTPPLPTTNSTRGTVVMSLPARPQDAGDRLRGRVKVCLETEAAEDLLHVIREVPGKGVHRVPVGVLVVARGVGVAVRDLGDEEDGEPGEERVARIDQRARDGPDDVGVEA